MASILNWNDFNQNKRAKKIDFNTSFVEAALNIVCEIHKKYPNRPLQYPPAKYLLDQQCVSIGNPVSEPSGIFGGACYTAYRLYGTCLDINRPSSGKPCKTPATWVFDSVINGAIIDVSYTQPLNQTITMTVTYKSSPTAIATQISGTLYWVTGKFPGSSAQMRWGTDCTEQADTRAVTSIAGFNAKRVDGLADDCGNAKPIFPPDPSPNASDYKKNINIVNGDNNNIAVSNRSFEANFFTTNLSFPINFTIDGAEFNFNYEGLSDGKDDGGENGTDDKPPEVYVKPKPFDIEDLDIEDIEETEEISKGGIPEVQWVVVTVTKDPDKRRIMTFSDPSLRHMWAGYFAWVVKTDNGIAHLPYETITKEKNIYRPPDGATGFRAYTINGAKIRTSIYTQKQS